MDKFRVSLTFKISKNYNSIGGEVSYESERKSDESLDDFFMRVYQETDHRFSRVYGDAHRILFKEPLLK